jgi:ABC-type transporter Mla MlaB component
VDEPYRPAFSIWGPITRTDLPGLCDRVCAVLADAAGGELSCDVGTVPSDAVTIEALALLQLAARRQGCRIVLRNASADLVGLVAFLGLGDVLTEEAVPQSQLSPRAAPAD